MGDWTVFFAAEREYLTAKRQTKFNEAVQEALNSVNAAKPSSGTGLAQSTESREEGFLGRILDRIDSRKLIEDIRSAAELSTEQISECLFQARAGAERDLLFSQFSDMVGRIDTFLATRHSERRRELEQRRTELWTACRANEDALKAVRAKGAGHQAFIHSQLEKIEKVGEKLADIHPPDSAFPMPEEVAAYNTQRSVVNREIAGLRDKLMEVQGWQHMAKAEAATAQQRLNEAIEQLNALDRELASL